MIFQLHVMIDHVELQVNERLHAGPLLIDSCIIPRMRPLSHKGQNFLLGGALLGGIHTQKRLLFHNLFH